MPDVSKHRLDSYLRLGVITRLAITRSVLLQNAWDEETFIVGLAKHKRPKYHTRRPR